MSRFLIPSHIRKKSLGISDTLILLLCGIICGLAGNCLTIASKFLESSVFAPIQYSQIISVIDSILQVKYK